MASDQTLSQHTFLGCEIVSASFSIGLGQSETSLNLQLIESVPNGQEPSGFGGYTGDLGTIHPITIEGVKFIGLLSNHSIKLGPSGRTISVTLTDGRSLLENIRVIIGKQYGVDGIYLSCDAGQNVLSALRSLEPGASSQFLLSDSCSGYNTEKCADTGGFMSSFSGKDGIPSRNITALFVAANQIISLPLTSQTLKINLSNLHSLLVNNFQGFFSMVSGSSISIMELIQSICDDVAADFNIRLVAGTVSSYELIVDVIDRSFVPAAYDLRDYVNNVFANNSLTTNLDYGQEATNTTTRKVVFGDNYRYFLQINDINRTDESTFRFHQQSAPFVTNWDSGFGNNSLAITADTSPDDILGIVNDEEHRVDVTPETYLDSVGGDNDLDGLSFKAQDVYQGEVGQDELFGVQTPESDLVRLDVFTEGEGEILAPSDCILPNRHRIFQILREDTFNIPSDTNIRFPPIQKVYLTRFGAPDNPTGFDIDWDVPTQQLLDGLQLTTAPFDDQKSRRSFQQGVLYLNGPPRLTLEELLSSSNYETYLKWISNHKKSVGYYCARILIDGWENKSESLVMDMMEGFLEGDQLDPGQYPLLTKRNKKQLELVQMHVKKIYDDYYGKEYAVLLDRKLLSHIRIANTQLVEGETPETNLASHDVCFNSAYNPSLAHTLVNGGLPGVAGAAGNLASFIPNKITPPTTPVSDLDEGYIYGYRISGEEKNFETSDTPVNGAWAAGPSQTGVLGIPWRSLDKFQNSDGTIAGFVNMGPKDEQCWRLGDLWGKYKPDVANLDFDSFVFHPGDHGMVKDGKPMEDVFCKAQFSPEMLFARLDDAAILDYESGGDAVFVRFSVPKLVLTQEAIAVGNLEYRPEEVFTALTMFLDGDTVKPPTQTRNPSQKPFANKDENGSDKSKDPNVDPVDDEEKNDNLKTDGANGSIETTKYQDLNPLAAVPCEVAIPFLSKTQVYGPFSVTADTDGTTEIVETDLAPWQFVSRLNHPNIIPFSWTNGLVNAGLSIAIDGVNARLFQEKANVSIAGIPTFDLTASTNTAMPVKVNPDGSTSSIGVIIDGININYGANGASTSVSFSSYTRKFGESEEYVRDAVKSLVNERRQTDEKIRRERNRTQGAAFKDAFSIPEAKLAKKKQGGPSDPKSPGESAGTPDDGGASTKAGTPTSRFNNNASDGNRSGGAVVVSSNYGLHRGQVGENSDEGSDVTTELRVHTESVDVDDAPVAITDKPAASVDGNKFTKLVSTRIVNPYSDDHNQRYYRNIALSSLDAHFLPVSISGGFGGKDEGNLSRFVNTLDSCVNGMRNRPYSSIPPLTITSLKDSSVQTDSEGNKIDTFFDLQICSTYLNPYTTKKVIDKIDGRTNNSTLGMNVSRIAVDKDAKFFMHKDQYIRRKTAGTEPIEVIKKDGEDQNTEVEFDRQDQEDFRFNAIRGPLVLQGWGYDTDGKPIPNDNDSAKNCEEGKFRNTGLKDKFLKNWLSNPKTWPVAPIDLRFDRNRGVWVAPTHSKILLARMKENLSPNGQAEAELINLEAGDTDNKIAYYKDTNLWGPDGEDIRQDVRNATVIVYDYLGMTVSKSAFVYLYYDDGKYIVINQKSVGGGGGAVVPARTISGAGSGGTFTAEIVDAAGNFDLTTDRDNEVTVTDYLNIIPYSIPQDTPITIADIGEVNSCVVSVGVPKAGVGFNSNVGGLIFDALPIASQVPTYFLGMNGSNLVRYRGVATCDEVLS